MTTEEAYQILGLERQATAAQVKQAYRRRALEWHPDRFRGEDEKRFYARKFLAARDAYEQLRREGFPELKDEPAPEPDFSVKTAGRDFTPERPEQASAAEKLGLKVPWDTDSVLLWAVAMPAGLAGVIWIWRYILRRISP